MREFSSKEMLDEAGKLFMMWSTMSMSCTNKYDELIKDVEELRKESFICQIIDKKFEVFHIDIKLPTMLLLLIETCANGNPGQSQMILSEVMQHCSPIKQGYEITPMDFAMAFPSKFPIVSLYSDINERLEKRWREQKLNPTHFL